MYYTLFVVNKFLLYLLSINLKKQQKMKKVFLSILVLGTISMTSCGEDKGREVEAHDAEEVVDNTTETTVTFDKVKEGSKINWFASHIGGVEPHNGFINVSEGSVKVTDGTVTNGDFTLDVTSITDEDLAEVPEKKAKLEGHLKSADFFDVENHPTAKFEITNIANEANEEGTFSHKVTGNLTLLDSTRGVTFFANFNVNENEVAISSERFSIDRTQWGVSWGHEGLADAMVSNAVGIEISTTLTK